MADIDERFAAYVRDRGEHHLRVAVLLTGDWHTAEDLVRASLVKLCRVWPKILAEIKEEATVTVAGPASGPGWTGTRYAFSAPKSGLSGTVTVDQQGRARALVQTIRTPSAVNPFVMTQVLTFSDFGAPVTVPPASGSDILRTVITC